MSFFSSPPTPFLSSPFMSSFSCSEPQDRNHIDFIQMTSLIYVSTLVRFDKIQLISGSSGQSPLPQYHCRPSLPGWGASSTHSPRPSWRNENIFYLDVGWQNTFYIHVSITWKTSGRPREGCGPNDPGVQPRLRTLQARTLRQIYSIYIISNHIWITWRKPSGPHKQQGVKLSSLGRLLF